MNESAYRFGEFHLIPARRELWCSGELVPVQLKVLETLAYLVQHRDRVVGRDELISAVWGRMDVHDNVLSQIVARARRAVGDTAADQDAIRTVARLGYRWVRDVEVSSTEADGPGEHPAALPDKRPTRSRRSSTSKSWNRWGISATALVLLGGASFSAWTLMQRLTVDSPKTATTSASSAAVTPAVDISTWPEAQRLHELHGAVASNRLDLARAIFNSLSDRDRARPAVRYETAELALKEGRFEESLRAFKALLLDLGEDGPAALVGSAFEGAGEAAFRLGALDSAQTYFELAIEALGKADPEGRVTMGLAWSNLGRLHSMRKAFDEADHAYAQARMILEATGDAAALARLESNVGVTLITRYRYAEALSRFQRAADLAAMTHDANAEARARMNLVNVQLVLLRPAAALASEPRLRELRDRIGDPVLAAHVDLIRAKAFTANGRLREASMAMGAEAGRPVPDDEMLVANRHIVAADVAFARGALDAGSDSVQALLASAWDTSEDDGVTAYALWQWLESSKATGDAEGVAEATAAIEAKSRAHPDEPTLALYASLARAEAADARGDLANARPEFERALAQAEANRVPFDLVRVVASYTQYLLQHGEAAEASIVAERIAGWAERDYTASLVQLNVYQAIGSEAWRSALERTRALAGERVIPAPLAQAPAPLAVGDERVLLASHLL